ncbi:MAG: dihydrolipoyl dehydrogenase [Candidatus Marinimicrobia bacterium]|nr:dihydrolipoyl dehydrogenase [Candidatus Neomarinimicrobiota bacterium]
MKQKDTRDVVVVGAGPGGYAAAFRAADLGKKVTLIDKDKELGGVCLNRGCIPSKALLHISKTILDAQDLSKMGVHFDKPTININKVRNHKNKIVTKLNRGISHMAKARGVEVICGEASFLSNHALEVKTESENLNLLFENCIIATGSRSINLPGLPQSSRLLTSKSALDLENIPGSLLVVGGGIIGLELGQVYSSLGSKVTVVEFLPNLIAAADTDIVKPLQSQLEKQFKNIYLSSKVVSVEEKNNKLKVSIQKNGKITSESFDKALVSVGRKPNTDTLQIGNTDILIQKDGFIPVNEYQQTNLENIYAIGDIVGNPMLAHKATHQGKVAAEVCAGVPSAFDVEAIPSVVYTDPEVAWVGVTELYAKEKNIPFKKGEFPWVASGRATAVGSTYGKTKILFSPENNKVIGVGIVGVGAGDLISEAALAIEMGADAEDLSLTIHPHPTLGETVGLSAEVFTKTITDLFIQNNKKG